MTFNWNQRFKHKRTNANRPNVSPTFSLKSCLAEKRGILGKTREMANAMYHPLREVGVQGRERWDGYSFRHHSQTPANSGSSLTCLEADKSSCRAAAGPTITLWTGAMLFVPSFRRHPQGTPPVVTLILSGMAWQSGKPEIQSH